MHIAAKKGADRKVCPFLFANYEESAKELKKVFSKKSASAKCSCTEFAESDTKITAAFEKRINPEKAEEEQRKMTIKLACSLAALGLMLTGGAASAGFGPAPSEKELQKEMQQDATTEAGDAASMTEQMQQETRSMPRAAAGIMASGPMISPQSMRPAMPQSNQAGMTNQSGILAAAGWQGKSAIINAAPSAAIVSSAAGMAMQSNQAGVMNQTGQVAAAAGSSAAAMPSVVSMAMQVDPTGMMNQVGQSVTGNISMINIPANQLAAAMPLMDLRQMIAKSVDSMSSTQRDQLAREMASQNLSGLTGGNAVPSQARAQVRDKIIKDRYRSISMVAPNNFRPSIQPMMVQIMIANIRPWEFPTKFKSAMMPKLVGQISSQIKPQQLQYMQQGITDSAFPQLPSAGKK